MTPGTENDRALVGRESEIQLDLSIDEIASLEARTGVPVVGIPPQYDAVLAILPEGMAWFARSEGVVGPSLTPRNDQVHIRMELPPTTLLGRTVSISQGAFPFVEDLKVVANAALLKQLNLNVGDRASVEIDNVVFTVHFVGSVPLMPGGSPRVPGIIANYSDLAVMFMQKGAPSPGVTSWWGGPAAGRVQAAPASTSTIARSTSVR